MTTTLIATKFHIPPVRPNLVPRPRLVERLCASLAGPDEGFVRKLTLISAPAGYGKTTLVSEWVGALRHGTGVEDGSDPGIAWLSLDEGDNDLTRFLTYLAAALRQMEGAEAAAGGTAVGLLRSPQPPPTETVLGTLINEIAAMSGRIVVVLDDCHLVEEQSVHDALAFLIEHLPPRLHLVIAARVDPPLPLARLRARGQLSEIRAADLRFSLPEAAQFLNQVMGLGLAAEDIAALEARTEGWIAGLQLAAISMQKHGDVTRFIESFTGSHRYVLDYLMEEVLAQQPEGVQLFLLQTSILSRMTGALCDAVRFGSTEVPAGQDDGQAILEGLEQSNLFIVPLDEERRWYRYHHLFADLLRRRLRQAQPEQLSALHQRASEWYQHNGLADEAIEHALRSADLDRAAQLIEQHADAMWQEGQHPRLQRWLKALPDELLLGRPQLCVLHGWYLFSSGQHDAAERCLQVAERAPGAAAEAGQHASPDWPGLRGRVAAVRAFVASYLGDVPGIIQHATQALDALPEQDAPWRCLAAIALGNAHGFAGDMNAAYRARHAALQACEAAGAIYWIMLGNLELAITLRAQGRLQQTVEVCQQQVRAANESGLSQCAIAGCLLAIWAEVLAEFDDLEAASHQAARGVELAERGVDLAMRGWSYLCLVRVLFSQGDHAGAQDLILRVKRSARDSNLPPWITNHMAAWQARLWLAAGNLEAAVQWVRERGLSADGPAPLPQEMDFFRLFDFILLARIQIAQGHLEEGLAVLECLRGIAEANGRTSRVLEILLLQALAWQKDGQTAQAMAALERALAIAEPEGFIRAFVDEGPPMVRLLHEAAAGGVAPDYTRRLLAAFPAPDLEGAAAPPAQVAGPELVEPLSTRELEVLQLVAQGLTNQGIASRLFLSLNTVKAHTRNIYGKLGVNSRTQAVAKARSLGLLPST